MVTNTRGYPVRDYNKQLLHYVRADVAYNTPGIASGVFTGEYLPSGAIIVGTDILVTASFNANSTNVLTVGLNGTTANNIVGSGDVNEASAILSANVSASVTMPLTADMPVYVKYTQTGGTVATTGRAYIIIKFVPNNS